MRKKVKFYVVYLQDNPDKWLTIVPTVKEAKEFASKLLRLECEREFKAWCYWGHKEETDENWDIFYKTDLLHNAEKTPTRYKYNEIRYDLKSISTMLRMFIGCVPLGCSFDNPSEISYFATKMKENPEFANLMEEAEKENGD